MGMSIKKALKQGISDSLGMFGYELVTVYRNDRPVDQYIPFRGTAKGAKKTGISISEYIDQVYAGVGTTQQTIDRLQKTNILNPSVGRMCEIGPGSGRYLEKVISICKPKYYEIYETAADWRNYLLASYPVVAQPCDGRTLCSTPTGDIDQLHAHRVFMTIPAILSMGYFYEIARVLRSGGIAVFDMMGEECFDRETVLKWIADGATYPIFLPRASVIDLFKGLGLSLIDHFFVNIGAGKSEYLVLQKE